MEWTFDQLNVIGVAGRYKAEQLPRRADPVYLVKPENQDLLFPPFGFDRGVITHANLMQASDLDLLEADGKVTRVPTTPAKADFAMWIDQREQIHYEPNEMVDATLRRIASDHAALAKEAWQSGDVAEARLLANAAVSAAPECLDALLVLALIAMAEGDRVAIGSLAVHVASISEYLDLRFWLKQAETHAGQTGSDDASAGHAAGAEPNVGLSDTQRRASRLLDRAAAERQAGRRESAVEFYGQVLDIEDISEAQRFQALFERAVVHWELGHHQEEISDYTDILSMSKLTPDRRARAFFNRGIARGHNGDTKGCIGDYKQALEQAKASADVRADAAANLGWVYYKEGRYAESARASKQSLALRPTQPEPRANLGLALLHLESIEEAMHAYEAAAQEVTDPNRLSGIIQDLRDAQSRRKNMRGVDGAIQIIENRQRELRDAR